MTNTTLLPRAPAGVGEADRSPRLLPHGHPDRQGRRHPAPRQPPLAAARGITNALDAGVPLRVLDQVHEYLLDATEEQRAVEVEHEEEMLADQRAALEAGLRAEFEQYY
ncbi:MAG: hypothetical protein H0V23_00090 [Nocardioidaceae bacterium]|nr:hypothetical protein [Nocardioidaceae bacterium]